MLAFQYLCTYNDIANILFHRMFNEGKNVFNITLYNTTVESRRNW
jgi:hypothetical protein